MASVQVIGLLILVLVQWFLLAVLLLRNQTSESHGQSSSSSSSLDPSAACKILRESAYSSDPCRRMGTNRSDRVHDEKEETPAAKNNTDGDLFGMNHIYSHPVQNVTKWEGVALGLMLRRPRWFYKRYNVMIHNALANIPADWGMQLMVRQDFFENELLDYHRGLKRMLSNGHPRVVVNILPKEIGVKKPKDVLKEPWLWQHLVGERIVMFHGTGALCSNTYKSWEDLEPYHFVGLPWGRFGGRGGWATEFSYRRKSAMLDVLESAGKVQGAEDQHFVSQLLKLNDKAGYEKYKLATPEVTNWFGGTDIEFPNGTLKEAALATFGPMVVVGTLGHLGDGGRNWVLGTCGEIKGVFPSLHNPNCFGAKPNNAGCAASLGFPPPCENETTTTKRR